MINTLIVRNLSPQMLGFKDINCIAVERIINLKSKFLSSDTILYFEKLKTHLTPTQHVCN